MTTTTDTPTVADLERALADLVAEQAGIDDRIAAARRDGDAVEWMRLQNRVDDLPGEITAARVAVLRVRLVAAWEAADAAVAEEPAAVAAAERVRAELQRLEAAPLARDRFGRADDTELRRRQREIEDFATGVVQPTQHAATVARQAVTETLAAVDVLEADLAALTGDDADTLDGSRPRPAPLARTTVVGPYDFPASSEHRDRWFANTSTLVLSAGDRPPRWCAVRLGRHMWEAPSDEQPPVALGPSRRSDADPSRDPSASTVAVARS